ncbi:DUF7010 family protein [Rheinheimera marina]|uniref:DUF7010 family protein n=1 Tax=Rheinheimera marina TaxID=1774958 RepID=A0ABV9JJI1_9GAMM
MTTITNDSLAAAQQDMREGYQCGAPGVLASALVWTMAALVVLNTGASHGVWALLIGGIFIHPLGLLLAKLAGRKATHQKSNPLGPLALENTLWLMFSLPLAYGLSLYRLDWFFPAMLLLIGGRYLTFQTLYGLKLYWACGISLAIAAFVVLATQANAVAGAVAGAVIELLFAALLYKQAQQAQAS